MLVAKVLMATASVSGATHPLHTTLTEVTVYRSHNTVRLVVRVFADDVGAALARRSHGSPKPESCLGQRIPPL